MQQVLLVDDDPAVRDGLPILVDWRAHGFEVAATAENGQKALELLQAYPFDLVITDVRMPVMDGITLVRQVHKLPRPPAMVILSAFSDFAVAQSAMRYGAKGYLLKPVSEAALIELLDEMHPQPNAPDAPGHPPPAGTRMGQMLLPIVAYINAHCADKLSLRDIAARFYLNPAYLGRIFKRYTGTSFNEYLVDCRIQLAKQLLRESTHSVTEVAGLAGYDDTNHFTRLFKAKTGQTPSEYRNQ